MRDRLQISVLGELRVAYDGKPMPLPASKKTRALLGYLAVVGRPVRRDNLCEMFMLIQALLGFFPDAPRNKLYVDPALPPWLPDLTVRDLRIGKHKLDMRFWREGGETHFEVTKGDPTFAAVADE